MEYTFLKKDNLKISKLGLGTKIFVETVKVDNKIYRNNLKDTAENIISTALDMGINLIESASFYPEHSLKFLATKLRDVRKSLILNFKVGYKLSHNNNIIKEKKYPLIFLSKKDVISEVENILKIFKTDYIDILTICGLGKKLEYCSDIIDAFYVLQSRGYIRFSGVYIANVDLLENESLLSKFNFGQVTYNLLDQDIGQNLSKISKKINIITCAPFANGIISRKYSIDNYFKEDDIRVVFYDKESLKKYKEFLDELPFLEIKDEISKPLRTGRSFIQGALRFIIQNQMVSSTVFCCSSINQLKENIGVFESEKLTETQIELIRQIHKIKLKK